MVGRGTLRTAAAIGLRAGRVVDAKKMAKHFDLPIPRFDPSDSLHAELVAAAVRAESIAAALPLPGDLDFVRARSLIRDVLVDDGVAAHIDALVGALLGLGVSLMSSREG